jgi:succinate dehydrogenase / fumarate reductase cytochrome b subunit
VSTQAPARPDTGLSRSSIGQKALMAGSGLLLLLFLIVHMLGNLKIFFGQTSFDHYAEWLRTIGTPLLPHGWYLWIQRGGLVVLVIVHMVCAWTLTRRARKARPVKYQHKTAIRASYSVHTMRWGGVVIILFTIYHILDLSTLTLNPNGVRGEAYGNVEADFSRWYVTVVYIIAMLALGLHVEHGFWSAAQTLGVNKPKTERTLKIIARVLAVVLTLGFITVPVAVLIGVVG